MGLHHFVVVITARDSHETYLYNTSAHTLDEAEEVVFAEFQREPPTDEQTTTKYKEHWEVYAHQLNLASPVPVFIDRVQ